MHSKKRCPLCNGKVEQQEDNEDDFKCVDCKSIIDVDDLMG